MRELKFRAFDVNRQLMHKSVLPIMSDAFVLFGGIGEHIVCGTLQQGVIMQYIGIDDINDKKIYEGDIITFKCNQCEFIHRAEVIWHPLGCWGIRGDGFDDTPMQQLVNLKNVEDGIGLIDIQEIIGNIHQHPDLLNERD